MNRISELRRSWSHQDEDSRNAVLLIAGISLVVILALAVVGYGYMKERASGNGDAVLKVGSWDVSYDYLAKRMAPFMAGTGNYSPTQFSNILSGILSQIEQEELMRYTAKTQGIAVSDDELNAEMRGDLAVGEDANKEVFAASLRRKLLTSGLSLDEYTATQKAHVVENKVRAAASDALPAQTEQVNVRVLKVNTQDDATAAKARLDKGESLAVVAGDVSVDSSSSKAGEVGWVARGTYDPKVEDVIFSQSAGTTSGIIEADDGFYIIETRAHETRDTTDDIRTAVGTRAFDVALRTGRDAIGSQIVMTTTQLNRLANQFKSSLNTGG